MPVLEASKAAGEAWRSLTQEERAVSDPSYLSFPAINTVETFSSTISLSPLNQAPSRETLRLADRP